MSSQFHVLRRQNHRDFRKPVGLSYLLFEVEVGALVLQLIVFFSKSLLRHPKARSELTEMIGDTHFQRYLPDPHPESLLPPEQIRRHILCSGMSL
jgi:2-oxoglutarate dehydrogenase E1 component